MLIVDNYDSFTYNIIQYVGEYNQEIKVVKNDNINFNDIKNGKYSHIIISPGPGVPESSGQCLELIKIFYNRIPILGICLGHQALGVVFNFTLHKHTSICHGKISNIEHNKISKIYKNIPTIFKATRYHSLIINKNIKTNKNIVVNSWLEDGTIMGVEHLKYPVYGLQYHPESIETKWGKQLIKNFIYNCILQ